MWSSTRNQDGMAVGRQTTGSGHGKTKSPSALARLITNGWDPTGTLTTAPGLRSHTSAAALMEEKPGALKRRRNCFRRKGCTPDLDQGEKQLISTNRSISPPRVSPWPYA